MATQSLRRCVTSLMLPDYAAHYWMFLLLRLEQQPLIERNGKTHPHQEKRGREFFLTWFPDAAGGKRLASPVEYNKSIRRLSKNNHIQILAFFVYGDSTVSTVTFFCSATCF